MQQTIPAEPLDIEMYSWEYIGAGEFAATFMVEVSPALDAAVLDSAVRLLLTAEPVLGCRLVIDKGRPFWERLAELPESPLMFTDDEAEYERLSIVSPKPEVGPQLSALLWRRPDADRFVIKTSHPAGDGGSVLYCMERLSDIYAHLLQDPTYVPAVSTGRRDFGQIKEVIPKRAYFGVVRDWVQFLYAKDHPKRTHNLGLPMGDDTPWHYIMREVDAPRLSALSAYGRARGATLNDVFLAAYYRALAKLGNWDGKSALRAICTIDMRVWHLPDPRVEAVCNLSSGELPFLGRTLGVDYEDTLGRVTKVMQTRKRRRPGLAIALLCPDLEEGGLTESRLAKTREMFAGSGLPVFTNAGRIDGARLTFGGPVPLKANFLGLKERLPRLVVCMSGYNGTMTLSSCAAECAQPAIEEFLDELLRTLPV